MEKLEDVVLHLQRFSAFDYVFFIFMLFLCLLIGLYFGFVKKRESSAEMDYLMGGRTMGIFPISLSLIARYELVKLKCELLLTKCFQFCFRYHTSRTSSRSLPSRHSIRLRVHRCDDHGHSAVQILLARVLRSSNHIVIRSECNKKSLKIVNSSPSF